MDSSKSSKSDPGAGNTKSAPKRQESPKLNFCWTVDASKIDHEGIIRAIDPVCQSFCFQLERGEEKTEKNPNGYLHYQGCMRLHKKQRWSSVLKLFPRGTELCPTISVEGAVEYCRKEETREGGPWTKGVEEKKRVWPVVLRARPVEWRPWQRTVLDYAASPPDERTIYWVYDKHGGAGKTTLGHELCRSYGGIPVNGKLADVLCMASEKPSRLYLVVAPRDQKSEDFPYHAMEMLKDGLWMKGKYEVAVVQREACVHVLVISNCPPVTERLTADRWVVLSVELGGAYSIAGR